VIRVDRGLGALIIYFIDLCPGFFILTEIIPAMFTVLRNKKSFSALALSLSSVALLACGGSSSDSEQGECLPSGSQFNLTVTLQKESTDGTIADDASTFNYLIQLTGNGTDAPYVSFANASQSEGSSPFPGYFFYRRTSAAHATVKCDVNVSRGQYEISGPVIVIILEKVYLDMEVTFNATKLNERCEGTGTGTMRIVAQNGSWSGTSGTASYYPTFIN
jgi:hypothetical protein